MRQLGLPSGVESKPVVLFDFGRNFGYLRLELVEAFSGVTMLGPNREVLSGFCCFCLEEGESVTFSLFAVVSFFVEGKRQITNPSEKKTSRRRPHKLMET